MFLGWYDPDKKRPASQKLNDAIARFREKFGRDPVVCITGPEDAAALAKELPLPTIAIQSVSYIPRHTLYVGMED